jgi:hypothetical protein
MTEVAFWSASAGPNIIHYAVQFVGRRRRLQPTRAMSIQAQRLRAAGLRYRVHEQLNSGLTGITNNTATTSTDATLNLTDKKQFVFNGSGSSSGNSVYFDVVLSGCPG